MVIWCGRILASGSGVKEEKNRNYNFMFWAERKMRKEGREHSRDWRDTMLPGKSSPMGRKGSKTRRNGGTRILFYKNV